MEPPSGPARKPPTALAVHLTLFAVQVAFASLAVAGKKATAVVTPEVVSFVRVAGATLIFGALHLWRRGFPRIAPRDLALIAVASACGIAANQLLFLNGLQRTLAINATVIGATIPVFTVLVAVAARQERIRASVLIGVLISLSGVLYLVGGDFRFGGETSVGDLLIVTNSLCYAVYLVLVRGLIARYGAEAVITVAFAFAVLFVAPFAFRDLGALAKVDARTAWLLVYIVISPTAFTYLASAWALTHTRATVVGIYVYVQPVFATVMAMYFLGEHLDRRIAVAAALVFAGIALVSWPRQDQARAT